VWTIDRGASRIIVASVTRAAVVELSTSVRTTRVTVDTDDAGSPVFPTKLATAADGQEEEDDGSG
jgi:hypothetical protein